MIDIPKALYALYPQVAYSRGSTVDEIQGFDLDHNLIAFDKNAVTAQAQKYACKVQAKQLLAASDWAALPDVQISNKADFENYRAILRGYVLSPVTNPTFPTEPTPVWE